MILSKVNISISGSNRTRLLNKLKNENILIYDLRVDEKTTFSVSQKNLNKVCEFADIYGVQVEALSVSGLENMLKSALKHLPYVLGATICFVMLIVSTGFVYNLRVESESNVYANKVENLLKENKLIGVIPKNKIDLKSVENLILNNIEEVSFATCYIDGFSLKIKIVANDPPKVSEKRTDLLSKNDAIITRVIVRSGTSEFAVGERVKAGDILIGGYHIADNTPSDGEENGERVEVYADGEVYGKVYTHKRFVIPKQNFTFVKTGKSKVKRQLGFNNLAVIKAGKAPYEFYELLKSEVNLFGILPIKVTTYEYFELKKVQIEQNAYIEQLKNKFDNEFKSSLDMDTKLLTKNYEIKEIEGIKYLDIFYETEQRIDNGGQNY
ncbi:MAG: sporulation protein YqfD [Clostridia bacterium]|nr:sporulation protein YqfD [Clostridia bacterium]